MLLKSILRFKVFIIILLTVNALQIYAADKKLKFAGGAKGGTYEKIVQSISDLKNLKISAINTSGSQENIDLLRSGKTDLALTQLDIFENLAFFDPALDKKVKILCLIYKEEVHVLANNKIKTLQDLKNKKLSIGPKESGIYGTAQIILTGLQFNQELFDAKDYPTDKALQELISGNVDAIFIVAGAPVNNLLQLKKPDMKNIHLVSFSGEILNFLTDGYLPYKETDLAVDTYPWMDNTVGTVAINSAIIVSSDFPDAQGSKLLAALFDNQKDLIKTHAKWKELSRQSNKSYMEKQGLRFHRSANIFFK